MPTFTSRNTIIGLGGSGGDSGSGNYIPMSQKAQPNGVATLDSTGKVPLSQLPPINSDEDFIVEDWDVRKLGETDIPYLLDSATYENNILTYVPYTTKALTVVHKTTSNIIYEDKVITYSGSVSTQPYILFNVDKNKGFRLGIKPENYSDDGEVNLLLTQSSNPSMQDDIANISFHISSDGGKLLYTNESDELVNITFNAAQNFIDFLPYSDTTHVFEFVQDGMNDRTLISPPKNYDASKTWYLFVVLVGDYSSGSFNINYELGLSTPELNNLFGSANYQGFPAHDFSIEVYRYNLPSFAGFVLGKEVYEVLPQQSEGSMCYVEVNTNSFYLITDGNPAATIPDFFNSEGIGVINYIHSTHSIEVNGQSVQINYVPKSLIVITGTTVGFKLNEFTQGGLINGDLPVNAKDGRYYKIVSDGLFNNKSLKIGDFAVLYDNTSDVIIITEGGSGGSLPSGNENEILAYNAQNQAEATNLNYNHWKNTELFPSVEDGKAYGLIFIVDGNTFYQSAIELTDDSDTASIVIRNDEGFLTSDKPPEEDHHVVNKRYVDSVIGGGEGSIFAFTNMQDCEFSFSENKFLNVGDELTGNYSYNLNLNKQYEWTYELTTNNFNADTYFQIEVDGNVVAGYIRFNKDTRTVETGYTNLTPEIHTMEDNESYVLRCYKYPNEVAFGLFNVTTGASYNWLSLIGKNIVVGVSVYNITDGSSTTDYNIAITDGYQNELSNLETRTISVYEKGIANGVATLDATGKIPSSQLPEVVTWAREKTLVVPEGETDIPRYAFYGNTEYTNIVLPNSIETIKEGSFNGCMRIKELEVPINVVSIGSGCFQGMGLLEKLIVRPITPPTLTANILSTSAIYLHKIYVPDASVDAYKTASIWSNYADRIYSINEMI